MVGSATASVTHCTRLGDAAVPADAGLHQKSLTPHSVVYYLHLRL